jgi:hypothetical protein
MLSKELIINRKSQLMTFNHFPNSHPQQVEDVS